MSKVGAALVEAFEEMAAHLRGEIWIESYEVPDDFLTGVRFKESASRARQTARTAPKTHHD